MVERGLRQAPQFRLAFVTPSHQQPLGASMSVNRRFTLLQAAENSNTFIIEDDYDGEFRYGGHPLPTLKSIDMTGGSFMWARSARRFSLRLDWVHSGAATTGRRFQSHIKGVASRCAFQPAGNCG